MYLLDFTQMTTTEIVEVHTKNSEYTIRYGGEGVFEISGGILNHPLELNLPPFITGIGSSMYFADFRTSAVQSVTIKGGDESSDA